MAITSAVITQGLINDGSGFIFVPVHNPLFCYVNVSWSGDPSKFFYVYFTVMNVGTFNVKVYPNGIYGNSTSGLYWFDYSFIRAYVKKPIPWTVSSRIDYPCVVSFKETPESSVINSYSVSLVHASMQTGDLAFSDNFKDNTKTKYWCFAGFYTYFYFHCNEHTNTRNVKIGTDSRYINVSVPGNQQSYSFGYFNPDYGDIVKCKDNSGFFTDISIFDVEYIDPCGRDVNLFFLDSKGIMRNFLFFSTSTAKIDSSNIGYTENVVCDISIDSPFSNIGMIGKKTQTLFGGNITDECAEVMADIMTSPYIFIINKNNVKVQVKLKTTSLKFKSGKVGFVPFNVEIEYPELNSARL